jgi:ABC-2 type transport system ATP-binding protein
MRSLLNITKIDSGEIKLLGLDHVKHEREIKKDIAVVFDSIPFDDIFTPKDMTKIFSGLYPQWEDKTYSDYLERFELPYKKKIGKFSKGMKMKLQIACALSHNAKLLIMDEATSGLDPVVRDEILHIFMEYMQTGERTILMSSHITSDLEKIADCVTFIDKGSVLISGYKDEVLDNHGIIKCSNDDVKLIDPLDIVSVRTNSFGAEVMIHNRQSAAYRYKNMLIDPASLEDIMLYYVNKGRKEWS